jgi:hypothetical protein
MNIYFKTKKNFKKMYKKGDWLKYFAQSGRRTPENVFAMAVHALLRVLACYRCERRCGTLLVGR